MILYYYVSYVFTMQAQNFGTNLYMGYRGMDINENLIGVGELKDIIVGSSGHSRLGFLSFLDSAGKH